MKPCAHAGKWVNDDRPFLSLCLALFRPRSVWPSLALLHSLALSLARDSPEQEMCLNQKENTSRDMLHVFESVLSTRPNEEAHAACNPILQSPPLGGGGVILTLAVSQFCLQLQS
uniref:Uncharacterized protein n=1 Tax=Eutreptiella gymnastica TaxID=73025 RepID=A0A7S1J8K8_9EUGL